MKRIEVKEIDNLPVYYERRILKVKLIYLHIILLFVTRSGVHTLLLLLPC